MRKCSNLPKNPSMEGIMCKLDEIMKKRETVYALARKYNVLRIFVFGSCARKEETPESDIDFLMDFKHGASMLDLIHFQDELETLFNSKVDISSRYRLNPVFMDRITKEAVEV